MTDLVVASNRGPFSLNKGRDGEVTAVPSGGGLVPSLAAALSERDDEAVWVASPMNDVERAAASEGTIDTELKGLALRLVDIDGPTYAAAYDVIANSTLWFLFHGLFDSPRRPIFDRSWREAWEDFRAYNAAFADRICEEAGDGAKVLVNDYHLPLVGKRLAEARPDLATVHFTHTPFATSTELAMLPRDTRRELIDGMAGFGACGFHTARWEQRFRDAAGSEPPPATFAAGLGANTARLEEVAASSEAADRLARLEDLVGDRRVILRSDRIELSKNLLRGFLAFDALLEERPDLRGPGGVCLVARGYASRGGLPEYLAYRSEVEHLVAVLNEKWTPRCSGVEPIVLELEDDFASTVAAYRRYDVLLVNPVRDGMNLVAKEGPVLNEHDGLLVCSEEAGAYEELGDVALGVQPFDVMDTAAALARALDMPPDERTRRSAELKRRCASDPPARWLRSVLDEARTPARS